MLWNKKKKIIFGGIVAALIATPTAVLISTQLLRSPTEDPDQDAKDTEAVENAFQKQQSTSRKDYYPTWAIDESVDKDKLGILEPEKKPGMTIDYKVNGFHQFDGIVYVFITIEKGESKREFQFKVIDFLTTEKFLKTFESMTTNLTTSFSDKLASEFELGNIYQAEELGLKKIPDNVLKGAKITFKIDGKDEVKGELNAEVEVEIEYKTHIPNGGTQTDDLSEEWSSRIVGFKPATKVVI